MINWSWQWFRWLIHGFRVQWFDSLLDSRTNDSINLCEFVSKRFEFQQKRRPEQFVKTKSLRRKLLTSWSHSWKFYVHYFRCPDSNCILLQSGIVHHGISSEAMPKATPFFSTLRAALLWHWRASRPMVQLDPRWIPWNTRSKLWTYNRLQWNMTKVLRNSMICLLFRNYCLCQVASFRNFVRTNS